MEDIKNALNENIQDNYFDSYIFQKQSQPSNSNTHQPSSNNENIIIQNNQNNINQKRNDNSLINDENNQYLNFSNYNNIHQNKELNLNLQNDNQNNNNPQMKYEVNLPENSNAYRVRRKFNSGVFCKNCWYGCGTFTLCMVISFIFFMYYIDAEIYKKGD